MKQEDWTQRLRDKLADYEEPAPADLWDDIQSQLQKLEAEKPTRRIPLWGKWAAAAAFAGLITGNSYLMWMIGCEGNEDNKAQQELVQSVPPMKSQNSSIPSAQEEQQSNTSSQEAAKTDKPEAMPDKSTAMPLEPETMPIKPSAMPAESEPLLAASKASPTTSETSSVEPKAQPSDVRDVRMQPVDEETAIRKLDEAIAAVDNRHRHHDHVAFGLYAANDMGTYQHANGVLMSREMLANYYAATRTGTDNIPEGTPPVYLYNYEERQKHYQPISFGLTAKIPISSGLSVSSGLVYTRLRSDFNNIVDGYPHNKQQTLHYLGIPLSAQYHLWGYKGLQVYASAGGQVDFCIDTKVVLSGTEVEMDKDRPQWSVQGALGVQFNFIPQLGIYAEPGVKHYFNNGSRIPNFFKDKPTNFNLQIGLRLNVGN